MTGIQLLLLTGVAFLALYFIIRLKKKVLDVILLFLMAATAILFILRPELTTKLAARLRVGRGADLVFYVSILLFWFVILKLYARIRKLEQQFTKLVRDEALKGEAAGDRLP